MNNQITATYTGATKDPIVIQFTKDEITQYGLKKVIQFHARKMKIHGYKCDVIFPKVQHEEPKVFHNPLNRLVATLDLKSLCRLLDVREQLMA